MSAGASPRVRVFAALELPPEWQQQLARVIADLQAALPRGSLRWVRAEGIHLTLKFYGEVAPGRLPEIEASLRRAAESIPPISLELQGLGVFPDVRRPRVIWAEVTGDLKTLTILQKAVDDGAAALGFASEARGFTPHLTLGRVNGILRPPDQQNMAEALARTRVGQAGRYSAKTLSLMRSELKPTGAVYTRLLAVPLHGRTE